MNRSVDRRYVLTALTTGFTASLAGCGFIPSDDEPDPIRISVYNQHDSEHTIYIPDQHDSEHTVAVTVTDPDGEAVVDGSVTLAGDTDREVGEFVPESPDERATYTISATLDDETSESLEFPVGGASGTTAAWVTITSDGTLELNHNTV